MTFNYVYLANYALEHASAGEKVLDYGCGKGAVVERGLKLGVDICGADVFYKDGRVRAEVERKGLLGTRIREIRDGLIDFPSNHFDIVLSNQVFEHIDDLESAVAEISRVLKPNGLLHALFPVRETWWEGHFGVPFLHLFPRNDVFRVPYARLWHRLGFGYHTKGKSGLDWARYVCQWVDKYTYYRSMNETNKIILKSFRKTEFTEPSYLVKRIAVRASTYSKVIERCLRFGIVRKLAVQVYRRRAGLVLTALNK